MGILTFTFIMFMLPLDIIFITSVIYRPKTTKWEDISYRWAFLNNLSNPILYLSLMKTGMRAVVSLFFGHGQERPRNNSERSVSTPGQHNSRMSVTSICMGIPSPTEISCNLVSKVDNLNCNLCDYVSKNKTELAKHRKKHKNRDTGTPCRQTVGQQGTESYES